MKNIYKIILFSIIFSIIFLILGSIIGYTIGFNKEHSVLVNELNILHPIRLNSPSHKLIDPLLVYVIPSADQDSSLRLLKNKISDLISAEKQKGLNKASVFMLDLNQGRWIGINENDVYPPASMFKVVIMVAYFKGAEQIPGLLDKKLTYTKDIDEKTKSVAFNSQTNLKVGMDYTVSELIDKMIGDSDNGAEELLFSSLDPNFFSEFFKILDINNFTPDGNFFISPRQYSLFFRIIYNATYLNIDLSEKALDILSNTNFKDGLVAGVPADTTVAHKYGEYISSKDNKITGIDLHDCGIVYYKDNPYFLCIMTNGNNLDELKSVIKNISSLVYQNHQAN